MPQTLLLRLPAPGQEETEWLSLNEATFGVSAKQRGPLSLAAVLARTAKVVALAPATQILLAEPELPPGSGVKLARAVPFALEEQLTEDIDELCFSIGPRRSNGRAPVAVVSRTVLQGWLAQLAAAGIEPAAIYADMSFVPDNPGQTILWLEKSRLVVRRPGALPFAVELTPVADALAVAGVIADPLSRAEEGAEAPPLESVILYATRDDWALVQGEFARLAGAFASLKVQILTEGPLPWLARHLAAAEAVNLLQGEFARTTDYGARWHRWRTAAMLAAGLLVAHVAAAALRIHQANRATKALDGEIAQIFAQTMPAETLQEPRRQMEARLERIRHSGAGPQYFLRTLEALSGAVSATPNTTVDAFSYRENSLDMKISGPSLAALSQLSQRVAKEGLLAEIESSKPVDTGVEAQMQIRAPGTKAHL